MDMIKDLHKLVQSKQYREALQLPREQTEEYIFLAQGEYNVNYYFVHPLTNQKLVLRINCGSQMHLQNQIEYEYAALKALEDSKRTPKAMYVDGSKTFIDSGILVMEFLEGKSLDYKKDLPIAANILADIHSVNIKTKQKGEKTKLLPANNSLKSIFDECCEMVHVYETSSLADSKVRILINTLLEKGFNLIQNANEHSEYLCCINTELNSSNFLITGNEPHNYLVDWEKPLLGEPAQDLGHFLAPTTSFWKTDYILNADEINMFIDLYIDAVANRFETQNIKQRVEQFIPITCLRGITWCAMAWVQYQQDSKKIKNEFTWKKLNQYLDIDFLNMIDKNYF